MRQTTRNWGKASYLTKSKLKLWSQLTYVNKPHMRTFKLTHCGLVMPYGDRDLGSGDLVENWWSESTLKVVIYDQITYQKDLNGHIFRVTGPCWGELTGHQWIPLTKASDVELWCFLWSSPEQTVEQTIETLVIWDAITPIMTSL